MGLGAASSQFLQPILLNGEELRSQSQETSASRRPEPQ